MRYAPSYRMYCCNLTRGHQVLTLRKSGIPAPATSLFRSSGSDSAVSMAQRLGEVRFCLTESIANVVPYALLGAN